jgi:DNA invertase Pin-like site-specific DNA recombinase
MEAAAMTEHTDAKGHVARLEASAREVEEAEQALEQARRDEAEARKRRLELAAVHREALDKHQQNIIDAGAAGVSPTIIASAAHLHRSRVYRILEKKHDGA